MSEISQQRRSGGDPAAYLRDAWYMAAWADEIEEPWLARRLLGEPILLFRRSDGELAALGARCPHRFAPLSRGKRVGDLVQCGYHGLRFDHQGTCVGVGEGRAAPPRNARVPTYPVVERWGMVWIWMGRGSTPDPDLIPDYSLFADPGYTWRSSGRKNKLTVRSNYLLVLDNLLDLTHAAFLHEATLGPFTPAVDRGALEVQLWPRGLVAALTVKNSPAPFGKPGLVDQWVDMRWEAPGAFWLDIGSMPAGDQRERPLRGYAAHIITPETDTTTHYFFGTAQPESYGDRGLRPVEEALAVARRAFELEDEPMLHACQDEMGGRDLLELKPILLSTDAAAMQARALLRRLIRDGRRNPELERDPKKRRRQRRLPVARPEGGAGA